VKLYWYHSELKFCNFRGNLSRGGSSTSTLGTGVSKGAGHQKNFVSRMFWYAYFWNKSSPNFFIVDVQLHCTKISFGSTGGQTSNRPPLNLRLKGEPSCSWIRAWVLDFLFRMRRVETVWEWVAIDEAGSRMPARWWYRVSISVDRMQSVRVAENWYFQFSVHLYLLVRSYNGRLRGYSI